MSKGGKVLIALVSLLIAGWAIFNNADKEEVPIPANGNESPQQVKKEENGVIEKPSISVLPEKVIQGEPAVIVVNGLATSTVESITFNGKRLGTFLYEGKPAAVVGIDLKGKVGAYPIRVELSNGESLEAALQAGERILTKQAFDIPESLGGNTPEAEKELNNTLAQEGAIINAIPVSSEKLWNEEFAMPLKGNITITDPYGYSRVTVGSTLNHKGVDLRAPLGTPVYAMNDGVVRFTSTMRNYGKTIAIDHGNGILTIYMHLSEVGVKEGQVVKKGDVIGKSGDTGYVFGPHLHVTVRINGISIDPMKFMELFGA